MADRIKIGSTVEIPGYTPEMYGTVVNIRFANGPIYTVRLAVDSTQTPDGLYYARDTELRLAPSPWARRYE